MHFGEAAPLCGAEGVVVAVWARVTCEGCLLLGAPGEAAVEAAGPRCQFGLCRRLAELEVLVGDGVVDLVVCGLHVTPVVVWGASPVAVSRVRRLVA